jgi:hypothetical protein
MNTVDEGEITMITTDWITDPWKELNSKPIQRCYIIH